MLITFRTHRLERTLNDGKAMDTQWGDQCGKTLRQRLCELRACATLSEFRLLPAARLHALRGPRLGQFAVDLRHPLRLIFSLRKTASGSRGSHGQEIEIVEVVDYHG